MKFLCYTVLLFITLQVDCRGVDVDVKAIDGEVPPDEADSSCDGQNNTLNEPRNLLVDAKSWNGYGSHNSDAVMPRGGIADLENFLRVLFNCPKEFIDIDPGKIEDTFFTLYNSHVPDGWKLTDWNIMSEDFDKTKKTKIITHGWTSNGFLDDCTEIKDAYLEKYDYNVIIFDWSAIASNVLPNLANVADHYAQFLDHLVDEEGANPKDIHLIGHSLGAHLTGFAGRRLKNGRKVGRITGLDPAGPGFEDPAIKYLEASDAEFVDVIHTAAFFLGSQRTAAHVDFILNGGFFQPGCHGEQICSHHKSFEIFAKSIKMEKEYLAGKCDSFRNMFSPGKCDGDKIALGESTPPDARGVYWLSTD